MFCLVCKAEYRPGITECPDCNAALVAELSAEDSPEAYAILWRGEDSVFHDKLCEELENSGIEYADVPLEVYRRQSGDPFNLNLGPQFGFVISVRSHEFPSATAILARLLNEEPPDVEIPLPREATAEELPPVTASHEHASVEIWAGEEDRIAQFLAAALQENEIPMRIENPGNQSRIYVNPADEVRAREIVKEVVEGVPPE
jgi:hypothetical protein